MPEPINTNIPFNGYVSDLYRPVRPTDSLGADQLVPVGSVEVNQYIADQNADKVSIKPVDIPTQVIDVHGQYKWTLSPAAVRAYIPVVEITEYRQVLSSELMGYAYSLAGTVDNIRVAARLLPTAVQAGGSAIGANLKRTNLAPLAAIPTVGSATVAGGSLLRTATAVKTLGLSELALGSAKAIAGGASRLIGLPTNEIANQDFTKNDPFNSAMRPYTGLYAVEPTGFIYHLPYVSKPLIQQTNGWGDPQNQIAASILGQSGEDQQEGDGDGDGDKGAEVLKKTGLGGALQRLGNSKLGKGTLKVAAVAKGLTTATGGAISSEKPQAYQGPTTRDTITVKFTLYNTDKFEDIKKNWEFCYLLTYQNLPNRKGINLMDPPKLYRLIVPGYKQFPMCWVTELKIENVGSVKMMDIKNGEEIITAIGARGPYIKMIPEAYDIEITFQHAFFSSQNLFAYAENPNNTVTTALNTRADNPLTG
jgi:hypothetical protein